MNVLFKLYKRYYFKKTREVSSNNQFKIPSNRNRNRHGGNIFRFFNIILFFAKCYYSMHILYHFNLSMKRNCRWEDIRIMSMIVLVLLTSIEYWIMFTSIEYFIHHKANRVRFIAVKSYFTRVSGNTYSRPTLVTYSYKRRS